MQAKPLGNRRKNDLAIESIRTFSQYGQLGHRSSVFLGFCLFAPCTRIYGGLTVENREGSNRNQRSVLEMCTGTRTYIVYKPTRFDKPTVSPNAPHPDNSPVARVAHNLVVSCKL